MSQTTSLISFHAVDVSVRLEQRRRLKAFITHQFGESKQAFSDLAYIFCSDQYLLQINQQFLQHDDLTDIISFPLHLPGQPIHGEIYISVERVRENAVSFGVSRNTELKRVIFHGALHLLGFKDKSAKDAATMREMEDLWLASYDSFHVEH